MKIVALAVVALAALGMLAAAQISTKYGVSPKRDDKLVLSDAEWKKRLTKKQYEILRAKGTEPAFCGLLYDNHEPGTYYCVGCGLALFKSDSKFISGTGWPSFFQPATPDAIWVKKDLSHGMIRDEVLCSRCDGHLGHVFNDGPAPTGLRFCMNSEVLRFEKAK
jgi:peptide-methionine (R)-S-oxide reductase